MTTGAVVMNLAAPALCTIHNQSGPSLPHMKIPRRRAKGSFHEKKSNPVYFTLNFTKMVFNLFFKKRVSHSAEAGQVDEVSILDGEDPCLVVPKHREVVTEFTNRRKLLKAKKEPN
jgi:hypothetical protein